MVFCNTEIHQLLKLPSLVAHYMEHLQSNHRLSFWGFLNQHYRGEQTHSDEKNHKNLPFKSHECQHMGQVFVMYISNDSKLECPDFFNSQTSEYIETEYHSDKQNSIWQPPQAV